MATKPKSVSDFDPCSQAPNGNRENWDDALPKTSGRTPQAAVARPNRGGSAANHGSYPKHPQRIRG